MKNQIIKTITFSGSNNDIKLKVILVADKYYELTNKVFDDIDSSEKTIISFDPKTKDLTLFISDIETIQEILNDSIKCHECGTVVKNVNTK